MLVKKLLFHPLTAVFLTLVAALLVLSLRASWNRSQRTAASQAQLSKQLTTTQVEITRLNQQLTLATSAATQERLIRDSLLMQKPGEYVIQVPIELPDTNPLPSASPTTPWQEWQTLLW